MFAKLMQERVPLLALVIVAAALIALAFAFHEYTVHTNARLAGHATTHTWHAASTRPMPESLREEISLVPVASAVPVGGGLVP